MSKPLYLISQERDEKILEAMRNYSGRLNPMHKPFINLLSWEGKINPPVTYKERERLWPLVRPSLVPVIEEEQSRRYEMSTKKTTTQAQKPTRREIRKPFIDRARQINRDLVEEHLDYNADRGEIRKEYYADIASRRQQMYDDLAVAERHEKNDIWNEAWADVRDIKLRMKKALADRRAESREDRKALMAELREVEQAMFAAEREAGYRK